MVLTRHALNPLLLVCLFVGLILSVPTATAQRPMPSDPATGQPIDIEHTLATLKSFIELNKVQQQDILAKQKQIKAEAPGAEREALVKELARLQEEMRATRENFREISAGTDISALQSDAEPEFDLRAELMALLKPAFQELQETTAHVRQKTALKEEIARIQGRLPIIEKAILNIEHLEKANTDKEVKESLDTALENWKNRKAFLESELQAAMVQLNKLKSSESSLTVTLQTYLKLFFKKRGLYLIEAMLSVLFVLALSRLAHILLRKFMPGFSARRRSFHIRLIELALLLVTIFFMVLAPMLVFYLVEDWVFFSLGILLLFGLLWTLVRGLPLLWRQIHLFLNIGAVREGERVEYNGLPWSVKRINLYCDLVNPVANMSLRLPINHLVDLISRPSDSAEPWFPCKKGDWVILSDGVRGKVTGISPEMVQLVERGGSRVTFPMQSFLNGNPRNLATNFRIKEVLSISYALQKESTTNIPETLHTYIMQRAAKEGYGGKLLALRVEFATANTSSLDIIAIADFKGELGDIYNRLRRTMQRWLVDACTENGWEIPFPQMTLHGELDTGA